jgi:hypothetical protein
MASTSDLASLGRIEKVIGAPNSKNCLARQRLHPISSMIKAMHGLRREVKGGLLQARALERLLNPRRLPTRNEAPLTKNFLLSIVFVWVMRRKFFSRILDPNTIHWV